MDGLISDYQARGTLALKRGSGLSQLLRPLWRSVTSEPTSLARPHTIFGRPRWSLRPGSLQGGAVGSSGPPGSPPCPPGAYGLEVVGRGARWARGLRPPESWGGEVCVPVQLGCVPWAEGSGTGGTPCGALETPGEDGGAERALPIFVGSGLGAEGAGVSWEPGEPRLRMEQRQILYNWR